jgi:hypothetical protein
MSKTRRLCLGGCDKLFMSEGPWNRRCTKCRGKDARLSKQESGIRHLPATKRKQFTEVGS